MARRERQLTGKAATPTQHGTYSANSIQGGEYGEGAPTYAGNGAIGIYYVLDGNARQRVVRLAAGAASQRTVANLSAPATVQLYSSSPAAVALDGSFYYLDAPTLSYPGGNALPSIQGAGVVFRVTPATRP